MPDLNRQLCLVLLALAPCLAFAKNSDLSLKSNATSEFIAWHSEWGYSGSNTLMVAEGRLERKERLGGNSKAKRWQDLSPEQRQEIEKRHKQYEALPASEKDKVKRAQEQFRELSPERRRELRDKWEKMSPENRRGKSPKPRDQNRSQNQKQNRNQNRNRR